MPCVQPGEQIVLDVEDLSHSGEGVGRWQGQVVFVPLAVPGDRVRASVVEVRKKYLRARLEEVLVASAKRCYPRCPSFVSCGGCHIQHLDYSSQLQYKTKLVRDSLERIGKLTGVKVLPVLGMDNPWHYRNKVRFHVAHRAGRLALGLYAPGSHVLGHLMARDAVCHILDGELNNLALMIECLLNKYRERLLDGSKPLLSYITLRKAVATGETMVVLSTTKDRWLRQEELAGELDRTGRVTTVVQQTAVLPDREVNVGHTRTLYG